MSIKLINECKNLMIVDGLNLAFRYKHAGEEDFAESYLNTVNSLRKSYKAKYVIIASDKGSSSYRKALHPEYKGTRKEQFANQSEADKAKFEKFFSDWNDTIKYIKENSNYPVIQFDSTEADDIAAYICCKKHLPVEHIWLISTDKDWDLLISKNVSRFSYITRKEVTLHNWFDKYEVTPTELVQYKCLIGETGSSSDNIPGVPGVGPKRAAAIIKEYGNILDAIPLPGHYKYIKAINESEDLLLLNMQLMDLVSFCEDALGNNVSKIDEILEEYIK